MRIVVHGEKERTSIDPVLVDRRRAEIRIVYSFLPW